MQNFRIIAKNILAKRTLLLLGILIMLIFNLAFTFIYCFYKGTEGWITIAFSAVCGILLLYFIYFLAIDRKKMYYSYYRLGKFINFIPSIFYFLMLAYIYLTTSIIQLELGIYSIISIVTWILIFFTNLKDAPVVKSNTLNKITLLASIVIIYTAAILGLTFTDRCVITDFNRNLKYEATEDGNIKITGIYSGLSKKAEIKDEYNGKLITEIGVDAFAKANFLDEIEVGKNVKYIYSGAFKGINTVRINGSPYLQKGALDSVNKAYFNDSEKLFTYEDEFATDCNLYINRIFVDELRENNPNLLGLINPIINDDEVCVSFDHLNGYVNTLILKTGSELSVDKLKITNDSEYTLYNDTTSYYADNAYYAERYNKGLDVLTYWYNVDTNQKFNFDSKINESIHLAPKYEKIIKYTIDYKINEEQDIYVSDSMSYTLKTYNEKPRAGFNNLTYTYNDEAITVLDSSKPGGKVTANWTLALPTVDFTNLNTSNQLSVVYANEEHNITASGSHVINADNLEFSSMNYAYVWMKDEHTITNDTLTVKECLDSGTYSLLVTATYNDIYGYTYTSSINKNVVVDIKKADYDMSGVKFEDISYSYDSNPHSQTIDGILPTGLDGIQITVSYDGSVTNVSEGKKEVTAVFNTTSSNYNIPQSMKANVSILPIDYDMSGVSFSGETFVYNGTAQHPVITGELPQGLDGIKVTVSYINAPTNVTAATTVVAKFSTTSSNYNVPENKEAIVTITKADYNLENISFNDDSFTYDGKAHHPVIEGILPTGADGIKVTVSYDGSATNVSDGSVLVTANFATTSSNYNVPDSKTAYVTITKANYNMNNIVFRDKTLTYNGTAQHQEIEGILPTGADGIQVTVSYSGSATNVSEGSSLVTAIFDTLSTNYNVPDSKTAYVTITKANYDMSGVTFSSINPTYNGISHHPVIEGTLPTGLDGIMVTVDYDGSATNVSEGSVLVTANFATTSSNYNVPQVMTAYVTIGKADYDMSGVRFENTSYEYDYNGTAQHPDIIGTLPTGLDGIKVTVSYQNVPTNATTGQTVLAVFGTTSQNYNTPSEITTKVIINKIDYDMSGITYDEVTLAYNGKAQHPVISGTLPTGLDGKTVTVSYVGSATNVTDSWVEVTAIFATTSINYNVPASLKASIMLTRIDYDMSSITFTDKSLTYNGKAQHPVISGTLPTGLDGKTVTVSYEGSAKDVSDGKVLVTAIFATTSQNYNTPASKTAYVTIQKANYDMSGISFKDITVVYDGNSHHPVIEGVLPTGLDEIQVTVSYEGSAKNVSDGKVSVTAKFATTSTNYNTPASKTAYVTIQKANYDMSGISFKDITVVYDGNSHHPVIEGVLPTGLDGIQVTVSYEGSAKNVSDGKVLVTAKFATTSTNYNTPASKTAYVTIKAVEVTELTWDASLYKDDGDVSVIKAYYYDINSNKVYLNVTSEEMNDSYVLTAKINDSNYVLSVENNTYTIKK